jgi:hypothetical protein
MPYQIIYSSKSATPMQVDELEDLLEQARHRNAEKGITGALVYVDGAFLQILEGEFQPIKELMGKISRDFRHETVSVLQEGAIPSGSFSDWEMAYVSATREQVAEWAGLSGTIAIPEILSDLRQDPSRATQLAKSILLVLLSRP